MTLGRVSVSGGGRLRIFPEGGRKKWKTVFLGGKKGNGTTSGESRREGSFYFFTEEKLDRSGGGLRKGKEKAKPIASNMGGGGSNWPRNCGRRAAAVLGKGRVGLNPGGRKELADVTDNSKGGKKGGRVGRKREKGELFISGKEFSFVIPRGEGSEIRIKGTLDRMCESACAGRDGIWGKDTVPGDGESNPGNGSFLESEAIVRGRKTLEKNCAGGGRKNNNTGKYE